MKINIIFHGSCKGARNGSCPECMGCGCFMCPDMGTEKCETCGDTIPLQEEEEEEGK